MYRDDYTIPSSHHDTDTSLAPTSTEECFSRLSDGPELQSTPRCSLYGCFCCCFASSYKSSNNDEDTSMSEEEFALKKHHTRQKRRLFRLAFIANSFFLLGSAVQVLAAFNDFQWSLSVQEFPVEILQADDDATWEAYQRSQGYQPGEARLGGGQQRRHLQELSSLDLQQYYQELQWIDLPFEIKHALIALGHNQQTWNGDVKSQLGGPKTWSELTFQQQEAALILGFKADSWNLTPSPSFNDDDEYAAEETTVYPTYGPSTHPTPSHTNTPTHSPTTENPTTYPTWRPTTSPTTGNPTTDPTWNPTASPTNYPTYNPTLDWYDEWEDDHQQGASDQNEVDALDTTAGSAGQLDHEPSHQAVAAGVKMTSLETDENTLTPTTDQDEDLIPDSPDDWKEIKWYYLPEAIRIAFESLGYNDENWQTEESSATEGLYWDELTYEQREQASMLGYKRKDWDMETWEKHQELEQAAAAQLLAEHNNNNNNNNNNNTQSASPSRTTAPQKEEETESKVETTRSPSLVAPTPSVVVASTTPAPAPPQAKPTKSPVASPTKATATTSAAKTTTSTPTVKPTEKPSKKPSPSPTPDPKQYRDAVVYNDDLVIISKSDYFDDDVIMTVGYTDIELSQVLLVVGSLFFLVMGVMNWIRDEQVFHVCVVQGSTSMILSAACKGYSDAGSIIFQALAYHCYLLEGIFLLRLRKQIQPLDGLDTLSSALWTADGLFGAGAVIGVVLGYWQFLNVDAEFDFNMATGKLMSACFWLMSSVLCLLSTVILSRKRIDTTCFKSDDDDPTSPFTAGQADSFL